MHHLLMRSGGDNRYNLMAWGVAQSWFLPDYVNWTNAQFDRARAQQPRGFVWPWAEES
jgi:hypothetical protein